MVMSVRPTVCVSTACWLGRGYLTAGGCACCATSGRAMSASAAMRTSLRMNEAPFEWLRRVSLVAPRPLEETILQQHPLAAAVDDLHLHVGALGDAVGAPHKLEDEARLRRGVVPGEAAAQRGVVEEERRQAHAPVLQEQR